MTELKTFYHNSNTWHQTYQNLNDEINKYARNNNLFIKNVKYLEKGNVAIANVLFSDIPNELFLL
jgi:hypothetical protein